jgi:hypothetical protein
LSALLTGVNRAFPYARNKSARVKTLDANGGGGDDDDDDDADKAFDEQADLLFRVVHKASFNTTVQALTLLYQVLHGRYYIHFRL